MSIFIWCFNLKYLPGFDSVSGLYLVSLNHKILRAYHKFLHKLSISFHAKKIKFWPQLDLGLFFKLRIFFFFKNSKIEIWQGTLTKVEIFRKNVFYLLFLIMTQVKSFVRVQCRLPVSTDQESFEPANWKILSMCIEHREAFNK